MSNVLELSKILTIDAYSMIDIPDVSLPYFNGITILDTDYIESLLPVYYGDEVDLNFWSMLKLNMGSSYVPTIIYTLEKDYKYIYKVQEDTFTIYDENNNVVFYKTNIISISDFSIDFSVYKSHQFEIHIDRKPKNKFFRIAEWRKRLHSADAKSLATGVQNIFFPDRVRPYLPSDDDNPSWEIKYMANIDEYGFLSYDGEGEGVKFIYFPVDAEGFRILNDINWDKLKCENNFYVESMYKLIAENVGLPAYGNILEYDSIILPLLAMGLYPLLNKLELPESIYNNRPVYEPWLIWGFYFFICAKNDKTLDDDVPIEDLYGISPNWSY